MSHSENLALAIGQAIKEARQRAGLSQQSLATKLGANVSASTVSRWERSDRELGVGRIADIADALQVPRRQILERAIAILAAKSTPPDESAPPSSA